MGFVSGCANGTFLRITGQEMWLTLGVLCGSLRLCAGNSHRKGAKDRKERKPPLPTCDPAKLPGEVGAPGAALTASLLT